MRIQSLLGQDENGLLEFAPGHRLLPSVVAAFQRLQHRAQLAGFDLQPVSAYRSFDRQLVIWNGKAGGLRPVRDDRDTLLQRERFSDWQWVQAILRFSALPGASRHHWGTDLDVCDAAAINDAYQVQLTVAECCTGGPFAALHAWLDKRIEEDDAEGFYRPYACDLGGVSPEPWHLSYRPLAQAFAAALSRSVLQQLVENTPDMALADTVVEHLDEIYTRFVHNNAGVSVP